MSHSVVISTTMSNQSHSVGQRPLLHSFRGAGFLAPGTRLSEVLRADDIEDGPTVKRLEIFRNQAKVDFDGLCVDVVNGNHSFQCFEVVDLLGKCLSQGDVLDFVKLLLYHLFGRSHSNQFLELFDVLLLFDQIFLDDFPFEIIKTSKLPTHESQQSMTFFELNSNL